MDVRTRRRVAAIALLVVLAACADDDGGDGRVRLPGAGLGAKQVGVPYAGRVRTDVLPMGEAVVLLTRNTLRFAFGGE